MSFGFRLPSGELVEGEGITPDVAVDDDWLSFSEAEDPGILAAVDALRAAAVIATEEGGDPPDVESVAAAISPSPAPASESPTPSAAPAATVTPIAD